MAAQLLPPGQLLARMRPTTRLLGLVSASPPTVLSPAYFGVAISDEYLSFAQPLQPAALDTSELVDLLAPHEIGGVALLEPLFGSRRPAGEAIISWQAALSAAGAASATGDIMLALADMPHSHWPARISPAEAQSMAQDSILWDEVGLPEAFGTGGTCNQQLLQPGIEAAAVLQHLLDEECGGWANTFG